MQGYTPPTNLPATTTWKDFSWDIANRNLILNSNFVNGTMYWNINYASSFTIIDDTQFIKCAKIVCDAINHGIWYRPTRISGHTYTFSVWMKADSDIDINISHEAGMGSKIFTVTTEWQQFCITGAWSGPTGSICLYPQGICTFYVANAKYEEGSVATPWCPAPEDPHNDGTLNNFAYNNQSGWIQDTNGYGLCFDGVDDYASVPAFSGLPIGNAPRTIECWFIAKQLPVHWMDILIYGNNGVNGQWFKMGITSQYKFAFSGEGIDYDIITNISVTENTLYHFVISYDNANNITIYINGKKCFSQVIPQLNTTMTDIYLCKGDMIYINYIIYSARIYNRALNDVEVQTNYMAGTTGDNYVKNDSLVLDLNANKNTKIYDGSGEPEGDVGNMAIATGQFTIIDYNDALSLSGYINSNQPKTQMFNPDNGGYNPDWTSNPYLVLTPSLFILGQSSDIITSASVTSVTWYTVSGGAETAINSDATHVFSGTKNQVLTIKANETAGKPGMDYMCKVIYHDVTTNMDLTYKVPISFSRVVNGGGIADAVAWCPSGNIFKNDNINSLTAHCDLWRGSVIDTTNVTYRWFMQDSSVWSPTTLSAAAASGATSVTVNSISGMVAGQSIVIGTASAVNIASIDSGSKTLTLSSALSSAQSSGATVKNVNYDTDAGSGWRLIPSDVPSNITGVTTSTITVYSSYVTDIGAFMCVITDTDSASNTYNQCFKDTVTFMDQTDPIQITIVSTGGNTFKNGQGSSTLTARVYQANQEIDAGGTNYTYTWTIYDKDGNIGTFNGGASSKTGKTITVGDLDVTVKATLNADIS